MCLLRRSRRGRSPSRRCRRPSRRWPETVSPEPIPSLAAAEGPGEPLAVSYMYEGEPTMVREFPAGTEPGTVSLNIP